MRSDSVQGVHVVSADGSKLGVVRELYIDMVTGQTAFLIIEPVGLLGGTGRFHPVPWSAVRWDAAGQTVHLAATRDAFKEAPAYDRAQLTSPNYGWEAQSARYFAPADL